MDIQNAWNRLNESHFTPGEPVRLAVEDLMRHPRQSPLALLRRNAWINMGFTAVFLIGFGLLFARFPHPYIRICIAVLMASYLAALIFTAWKLYRLPPVPSMDGPLLPVMKAYYGQLRSWLHWQEKVALFIYPVSVAAGGLLGISTEGNLDELLQEPALLWILAVAAIILTPLAHGLARWMGRIAFGKYLDQLKINIDLLEKD